MLKRQMNWLAKTGAAAVRRGASLNRVLAVAWSVVRVGARKRTWTRPLRNVLARQVLFTGVEAMRFVALLALMVGVSVVVQAMVWLHKFGQSERLGPLLVMVIIREAGPLLVNFIIIGRSGTAIATELGNMRIAGEVKVLDAQGLDPFPYLVVPRSLGAAIAVFCLTVLFIVVSFFSGYVSAVLMGANPGYPSLFVNSVFGAIQPWDVIALVAKTLIPGLITGVICCSEGLSVVSAVTEVPQAASRALVRSTAWLFVVSALISTVLYL